MKRIAILVSVLLTSLASAAWAQKSNLAPAAGQSASPTAPLIRPLPNTHSIAELMKHAKLRGRNADPNLKMAANIKVDCKRGGKIQKALDQLSPLSPSVVTVYGTCNENILIQGFNRLTLQGISGATINDTSGGTGFVVDIEDSTDILIQGFTINGGVIGVFCGNLSVCRLDGNTIQGASDAGFQAVQSRATFDTNTIEDSCYGLTSLESSSVRSNGGLLIQQNSCAGVHVDSGSSFAAFGTAIQDNSGLGIEAYTNASLILGSTTITANTYGVLVAAHSTALFVGDNVISANSNAGVAVRDLSYAEFVGANTITGNPGADVICWPQFPATRGVLTNIGGGTTNCVEP